MDRSLRHQVAEQDVGSQTRRFANKTLEAQYGAPGPINQARPVTDPQNQTSASLHSFNATARLVNGIITDVTAIGNAYRVQFEKVKQPVVAFLSGRTTNSIFGSRELNTLQPGTMVTCVWHEQMPYAQILGTIPPPGTESKRNQHGVLHGASRNRVDEGHKRPFRLESNGYIPAFLAGRPFDATMSGETGWMSETGVRAFVDSFMAMIGVDENCGAHFYYHDMLARFVGYQLQIWSSVRETESFNDQDEAQDWTGYAMYPWENMGLAARADPTLIKSPEQWQIGEPWYSKMEPMDDRLMPWHREREWHGYLGQGGKHSVVAPPIEFSDDGNKGSTSSLDKGQGARTQFTSYVGGKGVSDAKHPGLFDSFVTADGRLCIQSAKGISLVKRAAIMLPTRRRRPEDHQAGDTPSNYKFSSLLGGGPNHKITGDIQTSGKHSGFNRAAGIMDMHAYFFNYAGLHPFFYHAEDYKLYEESAASWAEGKSEEVPQYSELASEMYIDAEDYRKTWKIDHRYGEQQFYTLSCGFELLDDGGVMISDGYGGSIRMCGGSVEIAAPGDVWMKAGRNANVWAGYDAIIRAKHSWDITATERDGRLKAERNLFTLSGNGGIGGTLIESRGSGPIFEFDECGEEVQVSGVMLRSTKSPVIAWSREIYLRTGGPNFAAGPIVLDAGRGEGPITTYAQVEQNYINTGVFWHFNTNDEQVDGPSAMITDSGELFPGDMCVGGGIIADGGGIFNGAVVSTEAFAAVECPFVGCLEGEALQAVLEAIAQCKELMEVTIPKDVGQTFMDSVLKPLYYDSKKPGEDDVILKAEFSLRVQQDYKTENFELYEDRWQQLGRITGKANAKWEEKPVLCQGQETYPYPGKEAFESGSNYIQQDLEIFDANQGRSKDRGGQPNLSGPYQNPKFGTPQPVSLNEYTVIR